MVGRLNPGQRQQGHDAGWEMIHALITMAMAALAWTFGFHAEASAIVAAFYCGREHAQAEYRSIKSLYGGKRSNAPWWCGFTLSAWNFKSAMDCLAPVLISSVVVACR